MGESEGRCVNERDKEGYLEINKGKAARVVAIRKLDDVALCDISMGYEELLQLCIRHSSSNLAHI